jgi:hypothetical protein
MSSSVLERQVEVLRAMTPEQKVRASGALYLAARASSRPVLTVVLALLVGAGACSSQPLSSLTTGLTGTVVRGPVAPVCQTGESCDAPFSAGFTVLRSSRPVTSFRSDERGQFTVRLEPGAYTVVPGPDAPILSPQEQAKDVVAGPSGLTTVRLEFDTGIR